MPITVDGSKEGPLPNISHARTIMRGTRTSENIATVRAAPRPHVVYPVFDSPPSQENRASNNTAASPSPVFVNISYDTRMTPSLSRFNESTNTQQHIAIPVGQTPCAVESMHH